MRRAQETARLLAGELGGLPIETEPVLDGSATAAAILAHLAAVMRARARVAIVGHQPVLGELVALASAGTAGAPPALATGAVARVDFSGTPRAGGGQLVWLLPPEVLERLADGASANS
jgi:phosphohistidine phosphatase